MKHAFKLRTKLVISLTVTFIATSAVLSGLTLQGVKKMATAEFTSKGQAIAKTLAGNLQNLVLNADVSSIQGSIDEYKHISGVGYIYALDEKRAVRVHTFTPIFPEELKKQLVGISGGAEGKVGFLEFKSHRYLDISSPVLAGTLGEVHVGMDLGIVNAELVDLLRRVGLIALLLGVLGIAVTLLLLNKSLKQIIQLSKISKNIAETGNLDEPIPIHSDDEVGELAQSFSHMVSEIRSGKDNLERLVLERTQELESEKQLSEKQAVQLNQSNIELQQFAYVASHDLQEPLRMVVSYLQLLDLRYKDKLDDTAREYIGFATDGAKRMKNLIVDLLDYSRVGTTMKPKVELNAEAPLKHAMKNLEIAIQEANAQITYDPMPMIKGDEGQLERLFQNLIGNAIKYRAPGVTPSVHISAQELEGAWKFGVQDNGIGIPKEHYERVFQIFQRLHTAVEYSGTGIGLSVCQKIAQNHGGKIWVESELGKGSNFQFTVSASG